MTPRLLPLLLLIPLSVTALLSPPRHGEREAVRALCRRAAQGEPRALYQLARLHETGYDSIPQDAPRSTALYRAAARLGYPPAQNYLGFLYFKGENIRQDTDSALFWTAEAAANGDISAANNLGYFYSESDSVPRDYQKAAFWLRKAADAGMPQAQSQLADLLRKGLSAPPDTAGAVRLYNRAIDGGLRDAELKLLSMMGRKWENLPPDSALRLGRKYYSGHAPIIGVTLFETAALAGSPDAFALLGDAFSKGKGTDYSHDRSIEYFLKAARLGNPSAQFILAEMLDFFPDALPDGSGDSAYWREKAADAGVADAATAERLLLYPDRGAPAPDNGTPERIR